MEGEEKEERYEFYEYLIILEPGNTKDKLVTVTYGTLVKGDRWDIFHGTVIRKKAKGRLMGRWRDSVEKVINSVGITFLKDEIKWARLLVETNWSVMLKNIKLIQDIKAYSLVLTEVCECFWS